MHSFRIDDLILSEHWLDCPRDYAQPNGETIPIFAREVRKRDAAEDQPWAIFLQGGPGFGGPRPLNNSGWLKAVTETHCLLLLDDRGTGRSWPLDAQTLAGLPPEEQARRLACCRADSIVRDAEAFRALLSPGAPWLALGQSYGGWCITTYLSQAPEGLSAAIFAGGLPPVGWTADQVYRANYPRVALKFAEFFERFPANRDRLDAIVAILRQAPVPLPRGGRFTLDMLQYLGMHFYRSGGAESLNFMLETALVDGQLSQIFLHAIEDYMPFDTNPIFAVLHESIYADGGAPTAWAAERVRAEFAEFATDADPFLLTGEMIYPWMFDDLPGLRPLRDAAHILAAKDDWPRLYDPERLATNTVPCAAIVYYHDMCVGREYSLDFAQRLGNLKTWVTSEYEHDGIGVDGERIFKRLLGMLHGDVVR
jgi:pimeloyl-ACP methyl ester carboxylesterase